MADKTSGEHDREYRQDRDGEAWRTPGVPLGTYTRQRRLGRPARGVEVRLGQKSTSRRSELGVDQDELWADWRHLSDLVGICTE